LAFPVKFLTAPVEIDVGFVITKSVPDGEIWAGNLPYKIHSIEGF
jgi:hypothetical protein